MESLAAFAARYGPLVNYDGPVDYTDGDALRVLLTLARWRMPPKVLEMYAARGHTAVALATVCPETRVYTFDVCQEIGGYDLRSPFCNEISPYQNIGSEIKRASEDISVRISLTIRHASELPVEIALRAPYQFVYVDGDHTWRRVVEDTKLALLFCASDGVIVWDDYWTECPEVVRYLDILNERVQGRIGVIRETRCCYAVLNEELRRALLNATRDL